MAKLLFDSIFPPTSPSLHEIAIYEKTFTSRFVRKTTKRPIDRSSRSQTFFKIGVLKKFVIFTGKETPT